MNNTYPFVNTPLPYSFYALEPYIDEKTMYLHHDRHLQTYIDNLNALLKDKPALQALTLTQLVNDWYYLPLELKIPIRRNAGGVYNHRFYFKGLAPEKNTVNENAVKERIAAQFGSFDNFKSQFKDAAMSVFGSGYAWLIDENDILRIMTTSNQNTPDLNMCTPLLNIDVWEHAYYLKHYNKRADYIDDWFNVVDWNKVNMLYKANN